MRLELLSPDGAYLIPWAKQRLVILDSQRSRMSLTKLQKRFYVDNFTITIIAQEGADTVRIEGESSPAGFLCNPHVGDIVNQLVKTYEVSQYGPVENNEFHFQVGADAFLLVDDDKKTANVFFDEQWQANPEPPENYGNIDWIGTDAVLTWKGPACRHPLKPVDVYRNIPGFTHYEETVLQSGIPLDVYTVFSPNIYEGGEVVATAPQVSYPDDWGDGFGNYALVLGAAYTKDQDQTTWLVCIVAVNTRMSDTPSGFKCRCYARNGSSNDLYSEDNQGGWRDLGEVISARPTTCWFFNQSGNEAQCVDRLTRYKVTIDVNAFRATFTKNEQVGFRQEYASNTSFDNTQVGSGGNVVTGTYQNPPQSVLDAVGSGIRGDINVEYNLEESGNIVVGVEYKGDVEAPITVKHSLDYQTKHVSSTLSLVGVRRVMPGWTVDPVITAGTSTLVVNDYVIQFGVSNMCSPTWTTDKGTIDSTGKLTISRVNRRDFLVRVTATDSFSGRVAYLDVNIAHWASAGWFLVQTEPCVVSDLYMSQTACSGSDSYYKVWGPWDYGGPWGGGPPPYTENAFHTFTEGMDYMGGEMWVVPVSGNCQYSPGSLRDWKGACTVSGVYSGISRIVSKYVWAGNNW